ncbi:MAG: PQQ-dependent sugar dehydrogenase [Gemmatimonadales bacterium]|nr:PQQ-dependent sugar dehydrogenase [Gemmatimonadales bacterium]
MPRHAPALLALLGVHALSLAACDARAQKAGAEVGRVGSARVTVVASGLDNPWGIAFLPDGRALVTERPGRLRTLGPDGALSAPIAGVPAVAATGQGGLLDVALDPDFATNRTIYLSFSEPGEGGTAGTAVARAVLGSAGLEQVRVIYRQEPKVKSPGHYGSRLVFARDGTLFVTQGDRMNQRPKVQDLGTDIGKIVRINRDGSIPADNPFVGRSDVRPEIWSVGHRNAQGATLDAAGQLWTAEHGAMGGDELNRPEKGRNYGWPVISYGKEYSGASIGEGLTAREGMEQPVHYWDPSIGPGDLLYYDGDMFPEWRGQFFTSSMKFGHLHRLELRDGTVVRDEKYLDGARLRIRAIAQGPKGELYLLSGEDAGVVLRVEK